ncbi:hypothetical protein MAPG_02979 [Magnaporthiopsis poae ATCC 64411]|uniref:Uncharacterized protein n=1 Tax=Magnaporthiopsis poae (strain ATCC 64411 / 73-15) TaxID=644358 RepID=A0A0C4DST8_MAGP6|nr:hypothetical protein MAPG_02979 [Magnaporthiopsis poae ATCC 64411]
MVCPWKPCLVLALPLVTIPSQTNDTTLTSGQTNNTTFATSQTNDTTLTTVTPAGSSANNNTTMPLLTIAPMTNIQNNGTTLTTVAPARSSTNNNTTMPPPTPTPMTEIRTVTTKVATSTSTIWPKPDPTHVHPSTKDCYDRWDLCRSACLIWSWFTMGISCFKCLEDQKCHP